MKYSTIILFLFFSTNSFLSAQCTHPDYAPLISIYNALDGENWVYNDGWVEGAAGTNCDVCDWDYVSCDNNDRVISFSSFSNGYNGFIPEEIGNLGFLERINLSYGSITGGLPEALFQLTNLKSLRLTDVDLTGEISNSIGNLINLEDLYLNNNDLTGSIPVSIGNCTKLKKIFFETNDLTGVIPTSINNFTQIEWIEFTNNDLEGPLPELISEGLANINEFDVSHNEITGSIPETYGLFNSIGYLGLVDNKLSGCIPNTLLELCSSNVAFYDNPDLEGTGYFSDFCSTESGACGSVGVTDNALAANYLKNTFVHEYLFFSNEASSDLFFQIFNSRGVQISDVIMVTDHQYNLGHLSSGIYMIRFEDKEGNSNTEKLFKI